MNREWYLLEMGVSLNTYKTLEEAQAIKEFLPNATIIHVQEVIKDKEPTQATSELLRDANEIIESGRKSICYCDEKFICKPCEWLTKYEEVK